MSQDPPIPPPESSSRSQNQAHGTPSSRSRGRGRRGRGNQSGGGAGSGSRGGRTSSNQQASTPASLQPSEPAASDSQDSRRPRRGRGHGRGGRGGPHRGAPTQLPQQPRRQFGGHLTADGDEESAQTAGELASLSGAAPEFIPGQPIVERKQRPAPRQKPRQNQAKPPKSQADDLPTRIHEDISNVNYECCICTDDVLRSSQVWSCTLCWTVVHMKCVKAWYKNQKSADAQSQEPVREFLWRCPGCNSKLSDDPGSYHCWCGKEISPRPSPTSLPPHSCGQTCSKPRRTCPHQCPLQCHSGPCPPCDLLGPTQSCFCGKNSLQRLCRDTDYENGWSCNQVCDDYLPCGLHTCQKPCHPGLCGECSAEVEATCYCGKVDKAILCSEQEEPVPTYSAKTGQQVEGSFDCHQICGRKFDCSIHECSKNCHSQDAESSPCPYSPEAVSHCPCGKTPLIEIVDSPRESCEDPIPHCDKPCGKVLRCGHLCKDECHTGDCGSCYETVDVPCRCGRVESKSICLQGETANALCFRTCQASLSCGRHKCGERCCSGEKKATERQAAARKRKGPTQPQAVEAEHICIKTCDRLLKCGSHRCQQICHRGICGSCPEAIFEEVSCDCGRTVLQPPQPCGTQPPDCRYDCQRRPSCGHPPVAHNCHSDEVLCPKCPFLVDKWCACGKEKLHSQPCHLQDPHCGRPCGNKLKCGLHNCRKLCHREGNCEDDVEGQRCPQKCLKTKLFCDHPCQNDCHGQTPCNESAACAAKATIACPCGQHKQQVKCGASSSNPTPSYLELKCDDECLRLERNRRLAAALNIDPETHTDDHVPYSETTLRLYKQLKGWAETQEREFRVFSKSPTEVRLLYKPLPSTQRQFLHVLAEDYGLESQSEDVEPHRFVAIYKGQRFVSAPSKTLAQSLTIREKQVKEAAAASRPPTPPLGPPPEPFNAYIITAPRFGLTVDDIRLCLEAEWSAISGLHMAITFLPTDEVLVRANTDYSAFLSAAALDRTLTTLKRKLLTLTKESGLAGNIILCHVGDNDEVTRRENVKGRAVDASGWSAVAGRAATKRESSTPTEEEAPKASGRKLLGLRRKKPAGSEEEKAKNERNWAALGGDVEC